MDREERRHLLGDEVIAHIHARVAKAPPPSDEVVQALRTILARPAGESDPVEPTASLGSGGSA